MAKQKGRRLSLLCVRIDSDTHFQSAAGRVTLDGLFARLHQKLSEVAHSADCVSWPWLDGLAIVQSTAEDNFAVYRNVKKLLKNLERLLRCDGERPSFKVSVGVALYPDDGNTANALLRQAYAAAKRAGRWRGDGFCFSSRSVGREVAAGLVTEVELARALQARTVNLCFQPIMDIRQSRMVGVAASPAWRRLERGDQSAEQIMRTIERAGLTATYNAWLLGLICRQSSEWSRQSCRRRIGFHTARSQLTEAAFATRMAVELERSQVSADLVEIVIDGKLLFNETDHRLRTVLEQLAALGVQLTVANVGDERLPLGALRSLPFSTVEIAPSLVSTIGRCSASERTLTALLDFMGALELRTRATSVMSRQQLEFLDQNRCDEVSGMLLAPPMKSEEFDRLAHVGPCFERSQSRDPAERKLLQMH